MIVWMAPIDSLVGELMLGFWLHNPPVTIFCMNSLLYHWRITCGWMRVGCFFFLRFFTRTRGGNQKGSGEGRDERWLGWFDGSDEMNLEG